MYRAMSFPSFPRSGGVAGEVVKVVWWLRLVVVAVVAAMLWLLVPGLLPRLDGVCSAVVDEVSGFCWCTGALVLRAGGLFCRWCSSRSPSPISVVLAFVRLGGELGCGLRVGGGCSMVRLQAVFFWSRDVEAGWRRRFSLWPCLEVDEGVLAGARGGVPADGRSMILDSGVAPDGSCGIQRSSAVIEFLLVSVMRFARFFPPSASWWRWRLVAASGDEVVSPGRVACGVELVLGCMLEMYLSFVY